MCEKCGKSDMTLNFQPAANPPIEEAQEVKPEDVKLKVVKDEEPKDESTEESK